MCARCKSQRSRQSAVGTASSALAGGRGPSAGIALPKLDPAPLGSSRALTKASSCPTCLYFPIAESCYWWLNSFYLSTINHTRKKKTFPLTLSFLFMFFSSLCITVNRIVQTMLFSRNIVGISAWIKSKTDLQTWLGGSLAERRLEVEPAGQVSTESTLS